MTPVLLVDTGPLVALFNRRDQHHAWALAGLKDMRRPLRTNMAVLTEVLFLLQGMEKSLRAFHEFWESGALQADFQIDAQRNSVLRLLRRYRDLPMSLADACLVRMTELEEHSRVWTLDQHFKHYRRLGRQAIPCLDFPDGR